MPSDPTRPGGPRYTRTQRRLLTALAGLIVAALAGGAYALTYDVLRELALAGRVGTRWAPLYPAMADTLTAMTILSLVITRNARWWTRLLRWTLLLLLIAGGAALSVQHSVWGFSSLPGDAVRAGVAVAPHVMLVIAVWLWLTMFKQIRVARPSPEEVDAPETQRGHVKVLEPAVPEPLALEPPSEPEATPESSPAFLDDPAPEPEPLIPFQEPPTPQDATPPEPTAQEPVQHAPAADEPAARELFAYESATSEPTPHEPGPHEPTPQEPAQEPGPDEASMQDSGLYEPIPQEPATDEPASREPAAFEAFVVEESLSSEPAPPLDTLPEPRPPLDPLPEPPVAPPALLPTDVELIRGRDRDVAEKKRPLAATTRPDIVMPAAHGGDEDEHETPPSDRAEDPDAGERPVDEDDGGDGENGAPAGDWNPPPSSSFRSGPTPPAG